MHSSTLWYQDFLQYKTFDSVFDSVWRSKSQWKIWWFDVIADAHGRWRIIFTTGSEPRWSKAWLSPMPFGQWVDLWVFTIYIYRETAMLCYGCWPWEDSGLAGPERSFVSLHMFTKPIKMQRKYGENIPPRSHHPLAPSDLPGRCVSGSTLVWWPWSDWNRSVSSTWSFCLWVWVLEYTWFPVLESRPQTSRKHWLLVS